MKLLKDLIAFAVADVAIMFVVCVTVFSGSMTAKVIEQYQTVMMAYEEFITFRENNRR